MTAALEGARGREILTIEQLVARLAGGFLRPVNPQDLKTGIASALEQPLGELDAIKHLPGFKRAAAASLAKIWSAGLDLNRTTAASPSSTHRIAALATLESIVLKNLPANQLRPNDLVTAARKRIAFASEIFGRIVIRGRTEMAPVWRPLLAELNQVTDVVWTAEARQVPDWLTGTGISVIRHPTERPDGWKPTAFSCATAQHEILEALRWARRLLVQGIRPEQIALATPSPDAWDDHVLTLAESANLPIHFIHGRPALSSPHGQLAAATADVLLRGLSRRTVIRLVTLLRSSNAKYRKIHHGWWRGLSADIPLSTGKQWQTAIADIQIPSPDHDYRPLLEAIIRLLSLGLDSAEAVGAGLLTSGPAADLWKQALIEGPPAALDVTLAQLKIRDSVEPGSAMVWGPAAMIAAVPRDYCWLVGFTSRSWPRHPSEDPLLPNHIVSAALLDPLPVHEADRRDFRTIRDMASCEVVCSRARRDSEGRLNGISPLFPSSDTLHLSQNRTPPHALSEGDRLMARSREFARRPRAQAALQTWRDWHSEELSAHDGLMRINHPMLARALDRVQSASSLVRLLRDPLGYLWTYGFGWREPQETEELLNLDPLNFGRLLHVILERTVTGLEASEGFARASEAAICQAVDETARTVGEEQDMGGVLPPFLVWKHKVDEAAALARKALTLPEQPLAAQASWAELPFGGIDDREEPNAPTGSELPWDPMAEVFIPETGVRIGGLIDRLDLSEDRKRARVTDYKSGRCPDGPTQLANGAELQRCLYAFATMALIDSNPEVEARLLYPKSSSPVLPLDSPELTLKTLTKYINSAYDLFRAGTILAGPEANRPGYDLAFALPGGATQVYLERKQPGMMNALRELAPLWDED